MSTKDKKGWLFVMGMVFSSAMFLKKNNKPKQTNSEVKKNRKIKATDADLKETTNNLVKEEIVKEEIVKEEKIKEEKVPLIIVEEVKENGFEMFSKNQLQSFNEIWLEDSLTSILKSSEEEMFEKINDIAESSTKELLLYEEEGKDENKELDCLLKEKVVDKNIEETSIETHLNNMTNRQLYDYLKDILDKEGYVSIKETGFISPEDAVIYFFNSLREQDIYKALQCFSTGSYVENINFVDNISNNKWDYYPSEYELFYKCNWLKIVNEKATSILGFIINLMLEENDLVSGMGSKRKREENIKKQDALKLFEQLDTNDLSSLYWISTNIPNPTFLESQEAKEIFKKESIRVGGKEKTERIVFFSYNDRTFVVCFTFIYYDNGWRIEKFGAEVALSTPSNFNTPYKVSQKEYFSLTV